MNESNLPMTIHDLEYYANCLGEPWSWSHESFIIKPNKESSYSEMPEGTPEWKCCYVVIGYEFMETGIYGFGNTEEEALADCKKKLEYIFEVYGEPEEE